eukprot:6145045-Pyramimonas_sp.AAC.1
MIEFHSQLRQLVQRVHGGALPAGAMAVGGLGGGLAPDQSPSSTAWKCRGRHGKSQKPLVPEIARGGFG